MNDNKDADYLETNSNLFPLKLVLFSQQDFLCRPQENPHIKEQIHMVDVIKVILHFLP